MRYGISKLPSPNALNQNLLYKNFPEFQFV